MANSIIAYILLALMVVIVIVGIFVLYFIAAIYQEEMDRNTDNNSTSE